MIPFRKKEVEQKQPNYQGKAIITNGLGIYTSYNQKLMTLENPNDFVKKAPAIKEEYTSCIYSIVEYLRTILTDFVLDNSEDYLHLYNKNPLEINLQKMFAKCPNNIIRLINNQELPDLIYIIDSKHSPHVHLKDEKVEEAENFECLPGLDYSLAKSNFNKLFEGLTIFELRALLNQMHLLPANNNLDNTIKNYNERDTLHRTIIKDIVETLLLSKNPYDIKRARIFLSYFDVKYDLPSPEQPVNPPKILLKRPDC